MFNSEITSLESYMAQIERELRDLPASARADEMREIEAHLRAMIEASGDVAAVLAQFGAPRKVGRDLRRAWERKQSESWWRLPLAIGVGVGLTHALSYLPMENFGIEKFGNSYAFGSTLVTFFVAGLAMGIISPKYRPLLGWIFCLEYFAEAAYQMPPGFFKPIFGSINPVFYYSGLGVVSLILSLPCFYGVQIGARFSRKRDAKIADAK